MVVSKVPKVVRPGCGAGTGRAVAEGLAAAVDGVGRGGGLTNGRSTIKMCSIAMM